jgi:putative phosphoribosyl transferase
MWPPEEERFNDRTAAGHALGSVVSEHLEQLHLELGESAGGATGTPPLVLALPRGGAPVAVEVAQATQAEFDLILTTRIGLPWEPEAVVGAVSEGGPPVYDQTALASVGISVCELAPAVQRSRLELKRRQERYRNRRPAADMAGRMVVIVDDGLATGINARAAVRAAREAGPAHIVYAAPVCAAEVHDWLSEEADSVVDLHSPREFHALGLYYRDLTPLTDHDVAHACANAWGTVKAP